MILTIADKFVSKVYRLMDAKYQPKTVLIICDNNLITIDYKMPIELPDLKADHYSLKVEDTKLIIEYK